MPRPARDHEQAVLASGAFLVDPEGRVWRTRSRGRPCRPHRADSVGSDGYRGVYVSAGPRRARVLAHRLVWAALKGPIPDGMVVRHRNRDRGDNRISNLFLASPAASFAGAATGAADVTGVSGRSGGCAAR